MKTPRLSNEDIAMLAKAERDMDSGKLDYVVSDGGRLIVQPEVMKGLGLECGQNVSAPIVTRILECHLAACQAQLAMSKITPGQPT